MLCNFFNYVLRHRLIFYLRGLRFFEFRLVKGIKTLCGFIRKVFTIFTVFSTLSDILFSNVIYVRLSESALCLRCQKLLSVELALYILIII